MVEETVCRAIEARRGWWVRLVLDAGFGERWDSPDEAGLERHL